MAKMLNALLMLVAMDFAMVLFLGVTTPASSLFLLVTGIGSWKGLSLIQQITGLVLLAGVGGAILGSISGLKSDFVVFAGLITVFMTYGVTIMTVGTELMSMEVFNESLYLVPLILAPVLLFYIYTVLKFWRGND